MRPSEAAALADADLVVWIGPALTPWLPRAIASLAPNAGTLELLDANGTTLLAFREGATFRSDEGEAARPSDAKKTGAESKDRAAPAAENAHDHAGTDPHAWLDPANARAWLDAIAAALSARDPANAPAYARNAAEAQAEIESLTTELSGTLAPIRGKPFIVYHDAYHYFEHRFGIEATGAIASGDAAPPGPARIAEVRDTVAPDRRRLRFRGTAALAGADRDRHRGHEGPRRHAGSAGHDPHARPGPLQATSARPRRRPARLPRRRLMRFRSCPDLSFSRRRAAGGRDSRPRSASPEPAPASPARAPARASRPEAIRVSVSVPGVASSNVHRALTVAAYYPQHGGPTKPSRSREPGGPADDRHRWSRPPRQGQTGSQPAALPSGQRQMADPADRLAPGRGPSPARDLPETAPERRIRPLSRAPSVARTCDSARPAGTCIAQRPGARLRGTAGTARRPIRRLPWPTSPAGSACRSAPTSVGRSATRR